MSAPETSIRSLSEVCANSRMRAPGREQRNGLLHNPGRGSGHNHQIGAAALGTVFRLSAATSVAFAGFQACSAPQRARQVAAGRRWCRCATPSRRCGCTSMVNIRPIGPWPSTTTTSSGLRIALHHGFQAGIQRLHQRGALERDAVGNLLHAASHNPVHDAHVLREAAARGLESRRDPHFLIDRALRVQLALAVETIQAGNVMEGNDAIARRGIR